MKISNLTGFSLISTIVLGSAGTAFVDRLTVRAETVSLREEQLLLEGDFVEVAHETTGIAQIIVEDGISYLELDKEFKTDSGPALFVLLHDDFIPESYEKDNYISLGKLQATSGIQRYQIPEGTDVSEYGSVAIWCREFDVTFGYATLIARDAMEGFAPSDLTPLNIETLDEKIPRE